MRVAASCFFMPFFASFFFAKLFSAMLFFEKNLMIAGQTAAAVVAIKKIAAGMNFGEK